MEIRGKSISYASYKNKNRDTREKQLIKTVIDMEKNDNEENEEEPEFFKKTNS